jgi:hypothetical protein
MTDLILQKPKQVSCKLHAVRALRAVPRTST